MLGQDFLKEFIVEMKLVRFLSPSSTESSDCVENTEVKKVKNEEKNPKLEGLFNCFV